VNVPPAAAQRLRFLGSPTIRVGGLDVDPHTQERNDYALSCRVFQTESGVAGQAGRALATGGVLREAGPLLPAAQDMTKGETTAARHLFDAELRYRADFDRLCQAMGEKAS